MSLAETTLAAAVATTKETTISLTSVAGVSVGDICRIDAEATKVMSVAGGIVTVMRGQLGTQAKTHASGAAVFTGPATEFALPVIDFIGSSLDGTPGDVTGATGYIAILLDGELRYIPLASSVS